MEKEIASYYTSKDLTSRVAIALKKAGKDPEKLTLKDLSVIDQLHTGGHLATLELAKKANLHQENKILDAGCGIGGSSRLLAKEIRCSVTGIDLVDEFIDAANFLTKSTGFDNLVNFLQGDIINSGLPDNSFDCVWCQHTLMNIDDKKALFAEFRRVLSASKKGDKGKLVLHEVVKGEESSFNKIHLPVPWADDHSISFLLPWNEIDALLKDAGFTCLFHRDLTDQAKVWWQKVKSAGKNFSLKADNPRPLGPHIIFGKNGSLFGNTMSANLEDPVLKKGLIKVMEAVYTI